MVRLRDLRPEDKEKIRDWRNQPSVAQYQYTDHTITAEEHEKWFARAVSDPTARYWIITWNGEDVGLANLYDINRRSQRGYWAFYLAQDGFRGKGIGSAVEYLVLLHVFEELRLNKLCCEVLASNPAVVQMHKSFGFREEGRFRQHVVKGGKPADVHCLGMLRGEWLECRPLIEEQIRRKGQL